MQRIPLTEFDNEVLLRTIVNRKRRDTRNALLLHIDEILERYEYYEEHFDDLERITPLEETWEPICNDLQSCYGNNAALSIIKKEIFHRLPIVFQNKCPYCMLSHPNTLDHYFDKRNYPEYSVYTPNLVPCCTECNTLKGTQVFDDTGNRMFIHFYHDNIPSYKFLFFRFNITDGEEIPNITISFNFRDDDPLREVIEMHFNKLGLFEKYKNSINEKLSVIIREMKGFARSGFSIKQVYEIINIRYLAITEVNGLNFWEACIYDGIINCPELITN